MHIRGRATEFDGPFYLFMTCLLRSTLTSHHFIYVPPHVQTSSTPR